MRRLYRSGESEYLIDGEICRLRDVQDLLMDAGLGVKAYAVIEQGKIGQILSARPTDRRQLIEEAAGVTKYKSRRRAAELKLEAAQQNLTRVDDIVFEVEKQRGALKRQAAKARRYRRLREELRRWEKVQFAQRYRSLGAAIESARDAAGRCARAGSARRRASRRGRDAARAAAPGAHGGRRADDRGARGRARARAGDRPAAAADRVRPPAGRDAGRQRRRHRSGSRVARGAARAGAARARRAPRRADAESTAERDRPRRVSRAEENAYADLQRTSRGSKADVEAARSEVFAAVNAATALRHAMEHAAAAREPHRRADRQARGREPSDLRVEAERAAQERAAAEAGVERAREAMEALRVERAARESELAGARADARGPRSASSARASTISPALPRGCASLEELDAARADYGDGARLVLAESNGDVGQLGSVADYLEVDAATSAPSKPCLGDLLQHVVVATHEEAAAGLAFAAERNAGPRRLPGRRTTVRRRSAPEPREAYGVDAVASVVRVSGPAERRHRDEHSPSAWIARSQDAAHEPPRPWSTAPVVTLDG